MRSSSTLPVFWVKSDQCVFWKSFGWRVDVKQGLKLREILKGFQVFTNGEVVFPADLSQCYNSIRKGNLLKPNDNLSYRKHLT